ncbi:hypothetical protein KYB31_04085 [Clostridium felsineum]|uniref:hypothetical protein n=1 Tax=Clostridium felsineum TaxID=36839 RepID=UPI00098C5E59|nr:hypothetical protein [Clostridium felsineum]MCR3758177.1 hypothetical protein [Clostridium felsineum]URZ15779.1 hypothetical protein CLFE_018260 [Clostridium felsineum DSM 794]
MEKSNNDLFELMTKMYSEIQEINKRLNNVEASNSKNSLLLEKVDSNIKLLAEGQESFRDQIGRNNNDDKTTINDRLQIIELAVNSISSSITDMNDTIEVVKNTTASNDIDIKILKKQRKSVI